jgi:hypothetical protein
MANPVQYVGANRQNRDVLDSVNDKVSTEEKQDDIISVIGGFNIGEYDYVARAWTAGTFTEVWTFYTGGSGGTLVATITIVYDDVDKSNIVNVTKV